MPPGAADAGPPPQEVLRDGASLPATPTQARPGTLEKVLVMTGRADRREQLFHSQDAISPLAELPSGREGRHRGQGAGIVIERRAKKWRLRIYDYLAKKTVYLGSYDTEEAAQQAGGEARKKYGLK